MNEQIQASQSESEYRKGREGAMTFGGIVYAGVVLVATTLFISFILTAFPSTAYASRIVMVLGGLLVGGSMLAFPLALHNWAVTGRHRNVAVALYFGEMFIIAVNSVVSFGALLYRNTGMVLPEWIAWYEPFSIVSIVYTLFAWGTIFLTDPTIQRRAKERAAKDKFYDKVQSRMEDFLESVEGEEAIERVAVAKIQEKFHPSLDQKRHWGNGQLEENSVLARLPQVVSRPALIAPQVPPRHVRECPACQNENAGNAKFCASCGWDLNEPVVGYYRGDPMTKAKAEEYGLKPEGSRNGQNPH